MQLYNNKGRWRRDGGFTLVEVMVTLLLISIIFSAFFDLCLRSVGAWNKLQRALDVQDNLRIGLDRASRELRQAECLTENSGFSVLEFEKGVEPEKNDTNRNESRSSLVRVRYELDGNNLRRKEKGTFEPVASGINDFSLKYSPNGKNESATLVWITLSGGDENSRFTLSTCTRLRKPAVP